MRQLAGLIAMLVCVGCTSMGRLETTIPAPGKNESVFVLGVVPDNHRVMIFPGSKASGRFSQSFWLPAAFYGGAQSGFIVGKAKAGSTLAITMVRVTESEKKILGADFVPCGDAKTLVFDAQPGKVVYLGSVKYLVRGGGLQIQYWNDLNAARNYVASAYPSLAGRVEQGSYELLETTQPCGGGGTIYVPVYVPRSR